MTASSTVQPILQRKQHALDLQDLEGLLHIHLQIKDFKLFSSFYTRIDQVFILWGVITAVIFSTAQFAIISWTHQAIVWSVLTLIGAWGTCYLTWYWVTVERLRWVVHAWVGITISGVLLTDWGILSGDLVVLQHLCSIWLGVSAVGYAITAWGLKSRAFLISSVIHLGAISLLQYLPSWQFLWTGVVTAGTLFLLAETQWDMQSNNTQLLSIEQKEFNRQQQQLRDLET
jgi:hypothetical protein